MNGALEEIGAKMDGLGLWEVVGAFNWAVKPSGTAFVYFCTVLKGEKPPVKVRFLMLEGWQTLHDFVRTRVDRNFGYYSSPMEIPHFELVILTTGEMKLFRHDPCFMPREANETERELARRILWESYGIMMRMETERNLALKFAAEQAIFARVEGKRGKWTDEAMPIPPPRPYVENIRFAKDDLVKAKDLPFAAAEAVEVDFRLVANVLTQEKRPRCVYELVIADAASGEKSLQDRMSANPDGGLKALWEDVPPRILRHFLALGRIPGEVKVVSGRLFRLLRPLCVDLPFKLSLHDTLPHL